jgi:hypothetical protein
MGGGSTKQCGALFCLTFCCLLYPHKEGQARKQKQKPLERVVGNYVAAPRRKIYHRPQNFNGLG